MWSIVLIPSGYSYHNFSKPIALKNFIILFDAQYNTIFIFIQYTSPTGTWCEQNWLIRSCKNVFEWFILIIIKSISSLRKQPNYVLFVLPKIWLPISDLFLNSLINNSSLLFLLLPNEHFNYLKSSWLRKENLSLFLLFNELFEIMSHKRNNSKE